MNINFNRLLGLVLLLVSLDLFSSNIPHNFKISINPINLDELGLMRQAKLKLFLSEVENILPDKFKAIIGREVKLSFSKKLADKQGLLTPGCNSETFYPHEKDENDQSKRSYFLGKFNPERGVVLNYYFLERLVADDAKFDDSYGCEHGSLKKLAKATLIHELSHALDSSKNELRNNKLLLIEKCKNFKKKYFAYPNDSCKQRVREEKNNISDLVQYRHLSGWSDKGLLFPSSNLSYYEVKRSPLPYEYKDRSEHFPVNMEFFLLDPEYQCRRPALYKFFSQYFNHIPFPDYSCIVNTRIDLNNIIDRVMTRVDLKLKKIHSIHYLYATAGDQFSQKLGTGMFRVVLCRSTFSYDYNHCVKNSDDDIVFSYKKNEDNQVVVNIQSMMEIKYQYNDIEFRSLYSMPLKLDKVENELFFYQLLTDYWEFSGRYYLGGGTITTELIRPLKGAIVDYKLYSMHPLSPKAFYEGLSQSDLVDRSVMLYENMPERNGYLFKSNENMFNDMYENLKSISPKSKIYKNFSYYINKSQHKMRREIFSKINFENNIVKNSYINIFNQLEDFIFMKENYLKNKEKVAQKMKRHHSFSSNKFDYGIPFRD